MSEHCKPENVAREPMLPLSLLTLKPTAADLKAIQKATPEFRDAWFAVVPSVTDRVQ
jgi:hypothetical protein